MDLLKDREPTQLRNVVINLLISEKGTDENKNASVFDGNTCNEHKRGK